MRHFFRAASALLFAFAVIHGCNHCSVESHDDPFMDLPDIQEFITHPSDQFLVDTRTISAGHPFRGRRACEPHQGAHVHWDNTQNIWPHGGTSPCHYPAIYAVADGYVNRIDSTFNMGANDRYGVEIAFAGGEGSVWLFCYGIEPMVPEPSVGFYKQFILVKPGQKVSKGDTLSYMYLPPSADTGSHIHFHIMKMYRQNFYAPAIFDSLVVALFHARWGRFGTDGGISVPPCMGYLLDADENPYETGAVDILK